MNTVIAVDTETNGLSVYKNHRPFCAAYGTDETTHFVDLATESPQRAKFAAILADSSIEIIFQNAKFDLKMLAAIDMPVNGPVHDTMIIAHLLCCYGAITGEPGKVLRSLSLKVLVNKFLPDKHDQKVLEPEQWLKEHKRKFKKEHGRAPNFADIPHEIIVKRVCSDVALTYKLFRLLYPKLAVNRLTQLYKNEIRLIHTLIHMEDRGCHIDLNYVEQHLKDMRKRWVECENKMRHYLKCHDIEDSVNFNSPKQLSELLYERVGLFPTSWSAKARYFSTDSKTLVALKNELCDLIVQWRQYNHTVTLLESMRDNTISKVLHPSFIQYGTRTGRFSSSNPNMQNMPEEFTEADREEFHVIARSIRSMFIARPGFVNYHFDYRGIEFRMLAHFSQDKKLLKIFADGRDPHTEVSLVVYGRATHHTRIVVKIIAYGIMYGGSDAGVISRMSGRARPSWNLPGAVPIKEVLNKFRSEFPGITAYQVEEIERASKTLTARNTFGRIYKFHPNFTYKVVAYKCQGSAADMLKEAMNRVDECLQHYRSNMLMTIHDELVVEIHKSEESWLPRTIQALMCNNMPFIVPIEVKIEKEKGSWANLQTV